jgi:hypothetical protein
MTTKPQAAKKIKTKKYFHHNKTSTTKNKQRFPILGLYLKLFYTGFCFIQGLHWFRQVS